MNRPTSDLAWPAGHAGKANLPLRFWVRVGVSSVIALAVAVVVPHLASQHTGSGGLTAGRSPVEMLAAASAIIGAVTTGALYVAMRRDLKLPVTVALYAVAYEGLGSPSNPASAPTACTRSTSASLSTRRCSG